jgi:signal transduction histidine kinase
MINKLEKRFTIVAFLVMSSVLFILLTSVNLIGIKNNINGVDETLKRLSSIPIEDSSLVEDDKNRPPLHKEKDRAFDIIVDNQGQLIDLNYFNINILNNLDGQSLVDQVLETNSEKGFVEEYRYMVIENSSTKHIYFLDYDFEKRTETSFLWGSIIVFFTGILLFTLLIKIFLKPVMKPIKEAYDKQKRFITDASHELRTPLTIISINVQLAETEIASPDWLKSIQNQVKRLENLSEGLIALSRLDEENIQMEQDKINLSDIVNDVVMGFEPAIYAEGKTLNTSIDDGILVTGNHDALEKVLSTLLHNALKYSTQKGFIDVSLTSNRHHIALKIENATSTIEKGLHNELFERFYRAEASRNSVTGGFGIGLAIAKSIVEEHQGTIEAKSKDGKSFEINISLKL